MNLPPHAEVTQLLEACGSNDPQAANRLFALVYDELRRLAALEMRNEKPGQTLQATALVHEVWFRLIGDRESVHWENRGHFFIAASESMRRILIDSARARTRIKRGGANVRLPLHESDPFQLPPDEDLLALDEALSALELADPPKANLVKLRYFAGMTNAEASAQLKISEPTGERYWRFAKAWLREKMAAK